MADWQFWAAAFAITVGVFWLISKALQVVPVPADNPSLRVYRDQLAEVDRDLVVASHGAVSRALRGLVLGLEGPEVTELEVPQDKVLVLRRGQMQWL